MLQTVERIINKYGAKIRCVGIKDLRIQEILDYQLQKSNVDHLLFAVEGIWAHEKLIGRSLEVQTFAFCPECIYSEEAAQLLERWLQRMPSAYLVSEKVMGRLSEQHRPDGFVSLVRLEESKGELLLSNKNAVIVVLDGLENPGNIGTILRTCDGAGVDGVIISNPRSRVTHPKAVKSSMGALFDVPIMSFNDTSACVHWLRSHGFQICLADTRGDSLYVDGAFEGRTAIIMGNERYGISKEWYDQNVKMLSIPMLGSCDSLNVGVAASIMTYEICRRRNGWGMAN